MAARLYNKQTGVTVNISLKVTKDGNYSAGMLSKMGLDKTAPTGTATNVMNLTVSVEQAIEQLGWIGFKVVLEPGTGANAKSRLTHALAMPPDKNPRDLIGETYDGRKIIDVKMAAFPEHT